MSMWVYTQARRSESRTFLVDLTHLGIISVTGPHTDSEGQLWYIEASDASTSWILAEAPTYGDAVSIQRRIFNSLATGERAINLTTSRRPGLE
jgi:hypothetical protein